MVVNSFSGQKKHVLGRKNTKELRVRATVSFPLDKSKASRSLSLSSNLSFERRPLTVVVGKARRQIWSL